jgi:hypothetical protein
VSKRVIITGAASGISAGAKRGRFTSSPMTSDYLARLAD